MRRSRRLRHEEPEDIVKMKKKIAKLKDYVQAYKEECERLESFQACEQEATLKYYNKFKQYKKHYFDALDDLNKKMTNE